MEYINEFHKQWIERTRRSIEEWKKHPPTREEVLEQQKRLDQQRAIRENNQQNNKVNSQPFVTYSRPFNNITVTNKLESSLIYLNI